MPAVVELAAVEPDHNLVVQVVLAAVEVEIRQLEELVIQDLKILVVEGQVDLLEMVV
jgi:hypothetical protein